MTENTKATSGALHAYGRVKRTSLELTVIRADGRREPLGVVGYWHENPLFRLAHRIGRILKSR